MNFRNLYKAFALAAALPVASLAGVAFFDGTGAPPAKLSDLGIYTNIGTKQADTAMKLFEVNAALWSDGAGKKRWIVLPPGKHVVYNDTAELFEYPDSAMFVKNFYIDTVAGDTATRRYWETRVMINKKDSKGRDNWHGFSYRWRGDQSDADYVGVDGVDTVAYYYPNGLSKPHTYKKWFFPSQQACVQCHKQNSDDLTARGVLGFLPMQLKRPAPLQPGINQVTWLFNNGVFTGTQPTSQQLGARWKGVSEPIPTTLSAGERFKVIDSMARSYIAANCSGCHSPRNATVSGSPPVSLNFNWTHFKPEVEFGSLFVSSMGLGLESTDEDSLSFPELNGRYKYTLSVQKAGLLGTEFWKMTYPSGDFSPPALLSRHPELSPILYRQFAARRSAWVDSVAMRKNLRENDPTNIASWIFNNPWGSAAWRAELANHGMTEKSLVNDVMIVNFSPDPIQMPPLATNIPDTAAMRVLGEWATLYCTLAPVEGYDPVACGPDGVAPPAGIRGRGPSVAARVDMPRLSDRMLIVPEGWTGKAQMFSVSGRAYNLPSVGRGRYAIPQNAPMGVYLFKVGNQSFRASVLR